MSKCAEKQTVWKKKIVKLIVENSSHHHVWQKYCFPKICWLIPVTDVEYYKIVSISFERFNCNPVCFVAPMLKEIVYIFLNVELKLK